MAEIENEEAEVTQRTGNEWEVVQLTASAYNAAPNPDIVDDSTQHSSQDELTGMNTVESSPTMFMSGHFVFPPSQHENLPVEPEENESGSEDGDVDELVYEEGENLSMYEDENMNTETIDYSETALSNSSVVDESEGIDDSTLSKPVKGDDHDGGELPCEAWWKRRAISIYVHAKEANTIWSIIIAATVMGLVVIGHRWHDLNLKLQLGINDEKIARMMAPVSRLKDVIIGGHRRGSLIHGSFSTER